MVVAAIVNYAKKAGSKRLAEKKQDFKDRKEKVKQVTGGDKEQNFGKNGAANKDGGQTPVPDVGTTSAQNDQVTTPTVQPKKRGVNIIPEDSTGALDLGTTKQGFVNEEPVDLTMNNMIGMPPGTDVQGASIGGRGDDALGRRQGGVMGGKIGDLSGGVATPYAGGQTMTNDPRNVDALLAAGQSAIDNRTTPVEEPKDRTDVDFGGVLPQNQTPDAVEQPFDGAGAGGYTQTDGGKVDALGTSGVTGGGLTPVPGMGGQAAPDGTTPVGPAAGTLADTFFDDGTPMSQGIDPPPQKDKERVGRPSWWKVALDAFLGNMPLIPGSKLAAEPLARAREDYYKQDKQDQSLTDTFLDVMKDGNWDKVKQLARTSIYRDAVTKVMGMTPDDVIQLDQQIQANSTESLATIMDKNQREFAEKVVSTGGTLSEPVGVGRWGGQAKTVDPIKTFSGVAMTWNQFAKNGRGDWEVAIDVERDRQEKKITDLMSTGITRSQATLQAIRDGKGLPRYSKISMDNGVLAVVDDFTGDVKSFKMADAIKSNTKMEVFLDWDKVPIGFFMYDANQPVPTDMSKVTPMFFKDMLWGDQSKGRFTYFDALKGRVLKEKETPWSVRNWLREQFGGMGVTDENEATPMGDESSDYRNASGMPVARPTQQGPPQQSQQQSVLSPSTVTPDQIGKANDFMDEVTGTNSGVKKNSGGNNHVA